MKKILTCRLYDGTYNAWFDCNSSWLFLKSLHDDDNFGFGLTEEEAVEDLKAKHPFCEDSEIARL